MADVPFVSLLKAVKAKLAEISTVNGYAFDIEGRVYHGDVDPFSVPRPSLFVYTTDEVPVQNQPMDFLDLRTIFYVDFIDNMPGEDRPDLPSSTDEYCGLVMAELRRCLNRSSIEFLCQKAGTSDTFMQPARVNYKGRSFNFGPPMPGVVWLEGRWEIVYRDFADDPRYSG